MLGASGFFIRLMYLKFRSRPDFIQINRLGFLGKVEIPAKLEIHPEIRSSVNF
jgi:hypothetical protein